MPPPVSTSDERHASGSAPETEPFSWHDAVLRYAWDRNPRWLAAARGAALEVSAVRDLPEAWAGEEPGTVERLESMLNGEGAAWPEEERNALQVMRADLLARARERVVGRAGARRERAEASCMLGHAFRREGKLSAAASCYRDAEALYRELGPAGDPGDYAWVLGELGSVLRANGDLQGALASWRRMAKVARGRAYEHFRATALGFTGLVLRELGSPLAAERPWRQAYRLFAKAGDQREVAISLLNLGDILSQRGRPRRAARMYRRAVDELRQLDPDIVRFELARALYGVGFGLRARNRYVQEEKVLHECVSLVGDGDDKHRLQAATLWFELGRNQEIRGRLAEAEASCRRSLELFRRNSEPFGPWGSSDRASAVVLRLLGMIEAALGKRHRAEKTLLTALDHWSRVEGSERGAAEVCLELGRVRYALGKYSEATESLDTAAAQYALTGRHAAVVAELRSLLGDAARSLGRYAEAETALRAALDGFAHLDRKRRKTNAPEIAAAWLYLARVLIAVGRDEEAVGPLERAAATYPNQWIAWIGLIDGAMKSGEWSEFRRNRWMRVLDWFVSGLPNSRRYLGSGDQMYEIFDSPMVRSILTRYRSLYSEIGVAFCRLGSAARHRDSHRESFEHYAKAFGSLGRLSFLGWPASIMAVGLRSSERVLIPCICWTRAARRRMYRYVSAFMVERFLGRMLIAEGQFEVAEQVIEPILPDLEASGEAATRFRAALLLANVRRELGLHEAAAASFLQTIGECERDGSREAARVASRAWLGLGSTYSEQERHAEAEEAYGWVFPGGLPADDEEWFLAALAGVGMAAARWKQGRLAEAEAAYRETLSTLGDDPPYHPEFQSGEAVVARLRAGLADVLVEQGRSGEAEEEYRRALGLLYRVSYEFRDWDFARVKLGFGAVLRARGRLEEAHRLYTEALESIERNRAGQRSTASRARLASSFAEDYRRIVALCLELGRTAEAWHWAERGKARRLLDRLEGARPRLTDAQVALYDAWREAEKERAQAEGADGTGLGSSSVAIPSIPLGGSPPRATVIDREEWLRRRVLYEIGSEFVQVDVPPPETLVLHLKALASGRRVLFLQLVPLAVGNAADSSGDAYAVFALPLHEVRDGAPLPLTTFLFHPEPDGVERCVELLESAARLQGERRIALAEAKFDRLVEVLGRTLVQPLLGELAARGITVTASDSLLLVPGGDLHALPLHAAILDDGVPLLARAPVCYLGSASAARELADRVTEDACGKAPHPGEHVAMGPAEPSLYGARRETQMVSDEWRRRGLSAHRYYEEEMTVDRLVEHAGEMRILHLATHSSFRSDDALRSWIRFYGEDLTLGRLISDPSLDFSGMRLCYLSSCESGVSAGRRTEDLEGLVWAFIHAGAWAVHASLWRVDDFTSIEYARAFYSSLGAQATLAEAARDAALAVLGGDKSGQPRSAFYWAPFAMYGIGLAGVDSLPGSRNPSSTKAEVPGENRTMAPDAPGPAADALRRAGTRWY